MRVSPSVLIRIVIVLSGILLVPTSGQAQEGLLVRVDGQWEPAAYTTSQLNEPGMLCIRYNNYWCIKGSTSNPWVGQTGLDDRKHAIFETAEHGARAFFVVMRSYHNKHGLRTTHQIFNRYAPADDCVGSLPRDPETNRCPEGENPTMLYARRVAEALSLGPNDDIGLFDAQGRAQLDVALALARGVVQFELGPNRQVTDDLVRDGLALAGIETVLTAD